MSTESQNPSVNPNVHFQQCEPPSSWPVHKADQAVTRVRYAGRRHHTAIASTQAVYYFMSPTSMYNSGLQCKCAVHQ